MYPAVYAPIFSRLEGVRDLPKGWESWCPAHEDKRSGGHRSLSLRLGDDGRLMVRCHGPGAGCTTSAVLASIGLSMANLFPDHEERTVPDQSKEEKRTFVCAYDYRDEGNRLLYQVVRWRMENGGKVFSQRCPNPAFNPRRRPSPENREWVRGIEGVRRILYRLPDLIASGRRAPDKWVFIHEGEKAVDFARARLGLISTCAPMGAGKWNQVSYRVPLEGRRVAIIEDDDPVDSRLEAEPGQKHAQDIARSLFGCAKQIKILRLTEFHKKGDFVDWAEPRLAAASVDDIRKELRFVLDITPDWFPAPGDWPESVKQMFGLLAARRLERPGSDLRGEGWVGSILMAFEAWRSVLDDPLGSAGAARQLGAIVCEGLDGLRKG